VKDSNFKVVSRTAGDVAVIRPQGYLNNIAGECLVDECNRFVENGMRRVVLNFGETDFINSIGVSLLLGIIERLRECGGVLCFSNLSAAHRDTFEMLGITRYILVFEDEKQALEHLKGAAG
jgi:anti-sigma B factor antagonist